MALDRTTDGTAGETARYGALRGNVGVVPRPGATHIILVDDDDDFREFLVLHFADQNYSVDSFSNGTALLDYLESGKTADVILLDWKMPGMNGLEVLRQLRARGTKTPVIFLTGLNDDNYEEAALTDGAVDFISKSRRISILTRRIEFVTKDPCPVAPGGGANSADIVRIGKLELRFSTNRARWDGQALNLTLTEFRFVAALALKPTECITYRALYDLVHGSDFMAGQGPEGYRVNVRTFIKRIRQKFRAVDTHFAQIVSRTSVGYRWAPW